MFKKIVFLVLVLAGLLFIAYQLVDEPLPEGKEGLRAEWLAEQMLTSLNKPAWDSLKMISWESQLGNKYTWDKVNNEVEVSWDDYKAIIKPDEGSGEVWEDGQLIEKENQKVVDKAISYFYNDSFWLIAPYKIKDPGTIRKVVEYEGTDALLVQYTQGGVTPGDSYLWILDEEYRPVAWKFWVSILPVGGMEFTWENWEKVDGAQISTLHKGILDIEITNLKYE